MGDSAFRISAEYTQQFNLKAVIDVLFSTVVLKTNAKQSNRPNQHRKRVLASPLSLSDTY
jgi:hypothetical protein